MLSMLAPGNVVIMFVILFMILYEKSIILHKMFGSTPNSIKIMPITPPTIIIGRIYELIIFAIKKYIGKL